jgi:hypothetical protein
MVAVAFELQYAVHHVLQHFRPGDGTVFGDVADQHHRHALGLGEAHELTGAFAHLAHAAGAGVQHGGVQRLYAVDHH